MEKSIISLLCCFFILSCGYTTFLSNDATSVPDKSDSTLSIVPLLTDYSSVLFYFNRPLNTPRESKLKLHFYTSNQYGCSGYKIVTENMIDEKNINIKILGIKKPEGGCLTVMSRAYTEIVLNELVGNYKLNIFLKDTVNSYDVYISQNSVIVSGENTKHTLHSPINK